MENYKGELDIDKLKVNGLKVGKNFTYGKGYFLDSSHCFLISIGDNITFSSKVHVLAHDASTKKHIGYTKIGLVKIDNNVFIGANVTILPGIYIGKDSIVAAGSVVTKSIPEKEVWGEEYTFRGGITTEKKLEMIEKLDDGLGFVK